MTELQKRMIRLLTEMKAYVRHTDECYQHPDCSCGLSSLLQEVDDIIKEEKGNYKLTNEQRELVLSFLDGADRIQSKMGWTLEEFRVAALAAQIGQCPFCKTWCDDDDLIEGGEYDGRCNNCR